MSSSTDLASFFSGCSEYLLPTPRNPALPLRSSPAKGTRARHSQIWVTRKPELQDGGVRCMVWDIGWDVLIIFFAQVLYVSMMTLRWILLLKGHRYPATIISLVEVIVYVYALGLVVTQLNDFTRLAFYAAGYAVGQLVGTRLEELLAVGYTTVQIVAKSPTELPGVLREHGFGVTTWGGSGRDGQRQVLFVVLSRRRSGEMFQLVEEYEPGAFTLLMEPRSLRGGFLTRKMPVMPGETGPAP